MNRHQRRAAGKAQGTASSAAGTLQIGIANHRAGLFAEAERCYRRVLSQQPGNPDALHLIGCVYLETDRVEQGNASIARAIKLSPHNAEYHSNLATGLSRVGKLEDAAEAYGRAVDLNANSAVVFDDYGKVLEKLGRTAPALTAYAHAVMADPMFADAHINLGRMLQTFERHDDAMKSFDAAIGLRPEHALSHCHRGTLLFATKRFDEALQTIEQALALAPDLSEAHNIRGSTLHRMGVLGESLASFERAEALDPNGSEIALNKASTLMDLHRWDEALAAMERALHLNPAYAEAHNNIGLLSLLRGDFARGWTETEWRWKCPTLKLKMPDIEQPIWLGEEPLAGKTILMHSDQGLGDAINFARYATLAAEQGARVILAVEAALVETLSTVEGVAECVDKNQAMPPFDVHCPITSLPLAFSTALATIPAAVPYVKLPRSTTWRERLGEKTKPRIGLVWSGNPDHGNDHNRSLSFAQIAPLLDLPFTFYSLQKGIRDRDRDQLAATATIMPLGDDLTSFADTAALLSELDLLISADTSIAHLAGAIAMPTWVLLPHTPDWRWMLEREDSPWYPTMRLFRQTQPRQWSPVIETVAGALRANFAQTEREQRTAGLTARRCNYSLSPVL